MKVQKLMPLCMILLLFLTSCASVEKDPVPERVPDVTETPKEEAPITKEETPEEKPKEVLVGSAETTLLDKDASRLHNIRQAIGAVNGYVLAPGESFSFNQVVGERTPERGYKDATVIVHEEKEMGCGGGVCQLSTTIYQAAQGAGMTILERHSHQKPVAYAQEGSDASVNYGSLDMRFRNDSESTVKIAVSMDANTVSASLYRLP
ncbi:MAG: VanW family protein [Clostridia bacterium]|nr:VanW family protein [Clostridia bacterium]